MAEVAKIAPCALARARSNACLVVAEAGKHARIVVEWGAADAHIAVAEVPISAEMFAQCVMDEAKNDVISAMEPAMNVVLFVWDKVVKHALVVTVQERTNAISVLEQVRKIVTNAVQTAASLFSAVNAEVLGEFIENAARIKMSQKVSESSNDRAILEAKRMVCNSNVMFRKIAFELGFSATKCCLSQRLYLYLRTKSIHQKEDD